MSSAAIIARRTIAHRLGRFLDRTPPEVTIVHRDVIGRPLFDRATRSIAPFLTIFETASGEAIGSAERGGREWDSEAVDVVSSFIGACAASGTMVLSSERDEWKGASEIALIELSTSAGSMRVYLDPKRIVARHDPDSRKRSRAFPIVVSVEVASTTLRREELRALDVGDLVTLDRVFVDSPVGRIAGVEAPLAVTLECGELRLRASDHEGEGMDEDDALIRIDDARLELSIEVARIATTVGELSDLAVGELLATGLPEARFVTIRLGGKAIARGELVTHEGELAVRIVETAKDQSPGPAGSAQ